jgi:iron complex outermembrane receptor protein
MNQISSFQRGAPMTTNFRIFLAATVAGGAIVSMAPMAHAQSTGSIDFEEEIIVTGSTGPRELAGVVLPDTTKARGVLTDELIQRQATGNTILNALNLVPGVNFTQSDAYGSAGGNIRIRGFDGNRISLTFDGLPLNDSGNYAIYPNQMLDPELISQVNVNLGATDVDSPTASAAGGTVNYLTRKPTDEFGALLSGSIGEFNYSRMFGLIDTGVFTPFGTKAFISASRSENDKFKGPGKISKFQANVRIYQPIGDNGDFISLAGHYNANRNAFYRNPSVGDMRTLFGTSVIQNANVTSASAPISLGVLTDAQEAQLFNFENDPSCVNTTGTGSCSNYYALRINPSNTGNARWNSRFTLTDQLTFTLDGAYQYVLANGGGYTARREDDASFKGSNQSRLGVDFNGDGDYTDTIGFYTPNTTNTNRWTALASLIYEISPDQRVRVSYTFDRARHRQTGEWGYLDAFGNPLSVFGGRNSRPVLNADGFAMTQRDRLSIALLNQVSGQYLGRFFDNTLNVEVGIRAPFFQRDLETYCPIQATGSSGFATCTTQPLWDGTGTQPEGSIRIVQQNTSGSYPSGSHFAPFKAKYKYNKLLPNVGLTYKITPQISIFGSYAMGFSAPRTDNLYRAPVVSVTPETTNSFDLGVRYGTSKLQAQVAGWYIDFKNRIVTSFDESQGISVDRNVGSVEAYGFDANLSWQVIEQLSLYGFASYNHSEFKDDVRLSSTALVPLAGKRVAETPEWTVGGRAQATVGPVSVGAQWKWVDKRFATDLNDVIVPSYNTIDLDARFSLEQFGAPRTFFQLNVTNLLDKFYFGNISTQINHGTAGGLPGANPSFALGAPRTIQASVTVGF